MFLDNHWLKKEIEAMGFDWSVNVFPEKNRECLVVSVGKRSDGELQSLYIWLDAQADDPYAEETNSEPLSILNLSIAVCPVQEAFLGEVASFIFLINAGLNVPGFTISSADKYIYYRSSTFISSGRNLDILKSMMGIALFYVDGFVPALKDVASGKKKPDIAIKEILESGKRR